ncbi:MAG: hypothetical protein QG652_1083 [Pseudomonadota bacterium]|nr:hypothetical protein [Pseudomonadota bacterium]
MKFTKYFEEMRQRQDRAVIRMEWIQQVINSPAKEIVQHDGRYDDGPLSNKMQEDICAFFDRGFKP